MSALPLNPEQIEPVLAGTLALMTEYAQHPCPLFAEKISSNLGRLAATSFLSTPMRLLCQKLEASWVACTVCSSCHAEASTTYPNPATEVLH